MRTVSRLPTIKAIPSKRPSVGILRCSGSSEVVIAALAAALTGNLRYVHAVKHFGTIIRWLHKQSML